MSEAVVLLPINSVKPNPWNPNYMSEDEKRKLKDVMASSGPSLTPPIFVRKMDDHYEIIDGEQRWLVARELGWTHIPAIVRDVPDAEAKKLTLSLNYLKGRVNYAKIARWIRERKDLEMLKAFEETFGPAAARILEDLMKLPDEYLSMIEDAVQRGIDLTLSDLEPVARSAKPLEVLKAVLKGKKYMRDTTLRLASLGLEKSIADMEKAMKLDEAWRAGKLKAVEKEEEKKRRIKEEETEREVEEAERLTETIEPASKEAEIEEAEEEEEEIVEREVKEAQLPPDRARELLEASPEEALKMIRGIEALAELGTFYKCICGAVHALAYAKGALKAYLVKQKGGSHIFSRLTKEMSKWLFACPRCGLKFKVDFEDGRATPLWEENSNETGQS